MESERDWRPSDAVEVAFSMTIADPRRAPASGISRLRRSVVLPANGWPEPRGGGQRGEGRLDEVAVGGRLQLGESRQGPLLVAGEPDSGYVVVLPDGSTIEDERSPTES